MTKESVKAVPKERLHSLDVLRGLDMFWIVGGGALLGALAKTELIKKVTLKNVKQKLE